MSDESFVRDFLDRFSYVDWETGDDDKLRVDDYVILVKQDPWIDDIMIAARIELFENGVPVFVINEDLDDAAGDSGSYVSIMEMLLGGYEFYRTTKDEWAKPEFR